VITKIWSITKKELKSYYNSPIAYIIAVVFLVFMSLWLFIIQQFFIRNVADLRNYFMVIPNVFIFLIPAITMRSWAEEKKLGTEELLLTLPLKEYQVVVGKFLAALILLLTAIILTLPVPLSLNGFGNFEWGQIIGQYLGVNFFWWRLYRHWLICFLFVYESDCLLYFLHFCPVFGNCYQCSASDNTASGFYR